MEAEAWGQDGLGCMQWTAPCPDEAHHPRSGNKSQHGALSFLPGQGCHIPRECEEQLSVPKGTDVDTILPVGSVRAALSQLPDLGPNLLSPSLHWHLTLGMKHPVYSTLSTQHVALSTRCPACSIFSTQTSTQNPTPSTLSTQHSEPYSTPRTQYSVPSVPSIQHYQHPALRSQNPRPSAGP